ncbi:MAG: cytochrome C oxidase Cbb3 [Betaproteobacteria bacterium]|nr:cytochrome C oxidase Cbb3 [Betaproteobacteria bacterium]
MRRSTFGLAALLVFAFSPAPPVAGAQPEALYREHCAACHGADRLGGIGPALLPQNLERLRRPDALGAIRDGRLATQMPGFSDRLSAAELEALTAYIYSPLPRLPAWDLAEIRASRVVHADAAKLPARPAFKADPLNIFVVVETGDHHVTILDGERFERLARFPSRFALHGGPKFSPDGRFVYFASRDGWVSKYDIWNLQMVAEVRAGINTRNLAVSGDGRFVMVGNYLPHTLVALDACDLSPIRVIEVKDDSGRSSRVSAVYDARGRKSFIAALKDIREVWELTYDEKAEPVYQGFVHDFRMKEGIPVPGPFPPRRIRLDDFLDDFFFVPGHAELVGAARDGAKGQVVNLDVRRRIATVDLPGLPHLGSGISWTYQGRTVLATPNLKEGVVSVIDMNGWKIIRQIPTLGPGFFLRSHEATRYAWVDAFNSKHRDTMQLIDKETLEVAHELRPAPGKTAAHVEFSRDGRYALVSVWHMDGALVIYDTRTLQEVKRIPMKRPSGKYNVHNKITLSEGTSR